MLSCCVTEHSEAMNEPETKDDAEYVGDDEGINSVCRSGCLSVHAQHVWSNLMNSQFDFVRKLAVSMFCQVYIEEYFKQYVQISFIISTLMYKI